MKSAIAPMPMAIIALVMTKAHRADKNTKRQPTMKIAAWAGRRCSGVGRIVPSKWTHALLVALTASQDLFDHANDLFVEAKPPGLGQCSSHGKACCPGNLSLVVLRPPCCLRTETGN